MALKTWIDEIETAGSDKSSEAVLEPGRAPNNTGFTSGNDIDQEYIEKRVFAILTQAVLEIGKRLSFAQYHTTTEIKACEDMVNSQAKAILSGKSSDFDTLRKACSFWIETACKKTTSEMSDLFYEVNA